MAALDGRRIALLESRMIDELAVLVRRLGGVPVCAPAVREVLRLKDLDALVDDVAHRRVSAIVFLTGAGVRALFTHAHARGREAAVLEALRTMTVACRGPKPLAALKRHGVPARIVSSAPHTSAELVRALDCDDLRADTLLLVHYGEPNEALAHDLRSRVAELRQVCPYEWTMPEDVEPLAAVVRGVLARRLDAVLFTSQIQCRHLFQVAGAAGAASALTDALNREVIVGSVGPVCANALRQMGVAPDVIPALPNMASLISAVGEYFDLTAADRDQPA